MAEETLPGWISPTVGVGIFPERGAIIRPWRELAMVIFDSDVRGVTCAWPKADSPLPIDAIDISPALSPLRRSSRRLPGGLAGPSQTLSGVQQQQLKLRARAWISLGNLVEDCW